MSIFCQKFRKLQIFDWSGKNQAIEIIVRVIESSVVISKTGVLFSRHITNSYFIRYESFLFSYIKFQKLRLSDNCNPNCPSKVSGQFYVRMHLKRSWKLLEWRKISRRHDFRNVYWNDSDLSSLKFEQMTTLSAWFSKNWWENLWRLLSKRFLSEVKKFY